MSKNKMVIFKDYAEIMLCNRYGMESGKVKISIEDINAVESYRWSYNLRSGASSTIDGRHIGINRYLTDEKACQHHIRHAQKQVGIPTAGSAC